MRYIFALIFGLVFTVGLTCSQPAFARHGGGIHGGSHLFQEGAGSKSNHDKVKPTATPS